MVGVKHRSIWKHFWCRILDKLIKHNIVKPIEIFYIWSSFGLQALHKKVYKILRNLLNINVFLAETYHVSPEDLK